MKVASIAPRLMALFRNGCWNVVDYSLPEIQSVQIGCSVIDFYQGDKFCLYVRAAHVKFYLCV